MLLLQNNEPLLDLGPYVIEASITSELNKGSIATVVAKLPKEYKNHPWDNRLDITAKISTGNVFKGIVRRVEYSEDGIVTFFAYDALADLENQTFRKSYYNSKPYFLAGTHKPNATFDSYIPHPLYEYTIKDNVYRVGLKSGEQFSIANASYAEIFFYTEHFELIGTLFAGLSWFMPVGFSIITDCFHYDVDDKTMTYLGFLNNWVPAAFPDGTAARNFYSSYPTCNVARFYIEPPASTYTNTANTGYYFVEWRYPSILHTYTTSATETYYSTFASTSTLLGGYNTCNVTGLDDTTVEGLLTYSTQGRVIVIDVIDRSANTITALTEGSIAASTNFYQISLGYHHILDDVLGYYAGNADLEKSVRTSFIIKNTKMDAVQRVCSDLNVVAYAKNGVIVFDNLNDSVVYSMEQSSDSTFSVDFTVPNEYSLTYESLDTVIATTTTETIHNIVFGPESYYDADATYPLAAREKMNLFLEKDISNLSSSIKPIAFYLNGVKLKGSELRLGAKATLQTNRRNPQRYVLQRVEYDLVNDTASVSLVKEQENLASLIAS